MSSFRFSTIFERRNPTSVDHSFPWGSRLCSRLRCCCCLDYWKWPSWLGKNYSWWRGSEFIKACSEVSGWWCRSCSVWRHCCRRDREVNRVFIVILLENTDEFILTGCSLDIIILLLKCLVPHLKRLQSYLRLFQLLREIAYRLSLSLHEIIYLGDVLLLHLLVIFKGRLLHLMC